MILGTFRFPFFHIRPTNFCDARQCWLLIGWKLWVDKGWTFAMMDDREKGVTVCLKIWTCDVIIVWCRIYYVKRKKTEIIKHFLKCTLGAGWNRDPLPCSSTSFRLVLILILIYQGVDHCTKVCSITDCKPLESSGCLIQVSWVIYFLTVPHSQVSRQCIQQCRMVFSRHCPMCLLTGDSSVILWIGPFCMVVSSFGQFWGSEWEF